ncbi:sporulation delaying protein SdpC [Bacillus stercoris]|uniref:sporulation delaying protein SdpC n=1 Tax=Bacillus stercoris TaxID=2054641 RepID=UPI002DB62DE7|nr:sporulation delaying protein SdpC [Bacillus stercoris]MEC2061108.1 sporulation delaying protein SdpC [Bacillus stercoris]
MKSKLLRLLIVSMVTMLVFSLVGLSKESSTSAKENHTFSGEDYFRGLLFGQGEVGKLISNDLDPKLVKEANSTEGKKLVNDVVKFIKKDQPQYMDELKQSIDSKDPKKLIENMTKADQLIQKYAKKNENVKYSSNKVTPSCGLYAVCVAAGYLYVVGVNAVALQTAAAVTTAVWKYVAKYSSSASNNSDLEAAAAKTLKLIHQ